MIDFKWQATEKDITCKVTFSAQNEFVGKLAFFYFFAYGEPRFSTTDLTSSSFNDFIELASRGLTMHSTHRTRRCTNLVSQGRVMIFTKVWGN